MEDSNKLIKLVEQAACSINMLDPTDLSELDELQKILEQIDEFRTVEPTDNEFYDTRSYFIGSFAGQRETPQDIARDLWLIESQKLGKDYFKKLFKTLDKTTKQDCIELAQKTIDPDSLAIVVIGDAEKLKEPLAEIARVQVIELDTAKDTL